MNFTGHKSYLCGDTSFTKLFIRVLKKHIRKESKAKRFVSDERGEKCGNMTQISDSFLNQRWGVYYFSSVHKQK